MKGDKNITFLAVERLYGRYHLGSVFLWFSVFIQN